MGQGRPVFDLIELLDRGGQERLGQYRCGVARTADVPSDRTFVTELATGLGMVELQAWPGPSNDVPRC